MSIKQLVYLLPARTIEDLSLDRDNNDAEGILSAWTGLFHPALLARADAVPHFLPAEDPPEEPQDCLIVIPPCCESQLPTDWLHRAETAGAKLIRGLKDRPAIVAAALREAEIDPQTDWPLAPDFHALGYCYFLVEMLTRQLRYMTNLDEVSFRIAALAAAHAAAKGEAAEAEKEIAQAFTLLQQAREYFYPVESHLLDLTVVAPTTVGAELTESLQSDLPINLLVNGRTLQRIAQENPSALSLIRQRWEAGTLGVVGGEEDEPPLPLMTLESAADELDRGMETYERLLGRRPSVFGRRRFGLSPLLPQVLLNGGLTGALHATLDDGQFPTGNQSRIRWEGLDGSGIEAIARVPIDVAQSSGFYRLPEKLSSSMDIDHIATVVFAHWPGQSCCWFNDLQRIAKHTTVIGEFCTVETYFTRTGMAGQSVKHKPDAYRSPYLIQTVGDGQPDPISRWTRHYADRIALETLRSLRAITLAAGGNDLPEASSLDEWARQIDRLIENQSSPPGAEQSAADVRGPLQSATAQLCETLTGESAQLPTVHQGSGAAAPGLLVVNPAASAAALRLDATPLGRLPTTVSPVVCAGTDDRGADVVVEVPGMGFAWVAAGNADAPATESKRGWFFRRRAKTANPVASENILENEFFQVVVDRRFGGIRAVLDPLSRGPRLAQQLALRWPEGDPNDPGHESHYTIPAADELRVVRAGPVVGEIVTSGRMMDAQGKLRGRFVQLTRVVKGSRLIEIEIELDVADPPKSRPWQSYYTARFAWSDETASLRRSVHGASVPTDSTQFEAPEFWEIQTAKTRTAVLTGGLPYHRKVGFRRLDTLLVVAGETQRRFRLAIGVECPSPAAAAREWMTPAIVIPSAAPPVNFGWLFHVESRSVVATRWTPLFVLPPLDAADPETSTTETPESAASATIASTETEAGAAAHGATADSLQNRLRGVRVRLQETEGRGVRFGLRAPRPLALARRRYAGQWKTLAIEGDRAEVELPAYAWCEIELRFV